MKVLIVVLCVSVAIMLLELPLARGLKVSDLISKWETKVDHERTEALKLRSRPSPASLRAMIIEPQVPTSTVAYPELLSPNVITAPVLPSPMVNEHETNSPLKEESTESMAIETSHEDSHEVKATEPSDQDDQPLPNYVALDE